MRWAHEVVEILPRPVDGWQLGLLSSPAHFPKGAAYQLPFVWFCTYWSGGAYTLQRRRLNYGRRHWLWWSRIRKISWESFNGERRRGRMLVVARLSPMASLTLVIGSRERKRLKHVRVQRRESRLSVVFISPLFSRIRRRLFPLVCVSGAYIWTPMDSFSFQFRGWTFWTLYIQVYHFNLYLDFLIWDFHNM